MEENSYEKKAGCGVLGVMFGRRGLRSKRSMVENGSRKSTSSNNTQTNNIQFTKSPGVEINSKQSQVVRDEQKGLSEPIQNQRPASKPSSTQCPNTHQLGYGNHRPYSNGSNSNEPYKGSVQQQARKVPRGAIGISGELESMITDHQKSRGNNAILYGNLGNLKHSATTGNYGNAQNQMGVQSNVNGTRSMNNEGRRTGEAAVTKSSDQSGSLCRAISTRMDPETLKIMGNEDYKNGNFAEALALYDAAIAIDPNKAAYRSNKSASLTAMGKILEAVFECREAIRIEPHYHRAHHRLANLYLTLGEVEKATYHFKHSGPEADSKDMAKAKVVQTHLNKCMEAKNRRDWSNLIKETTNAISAGADRAPQVYALQAEALLKTNRHDEADNVLFRSPKFDVEISTKYYGGIGYASFLVVWAQVHLASGRVEEAVEAIQRAAKLDGKNREIEMVRRKAEGVREARTRGNQLFKAGRFEEACVAYGEGLNHDPRNSVLLCNRAASLSKLTLFDKAVHDCSAALSLRPAYTKARLRRALCNAKLGKWVAAVEDYEILKKEMPDDEEVERGLAEARQHLMKGRR